MDIIFTVDTRQWDKSLRAWMALATPEGLQKPTETTLDTVLIPQTRYPPPGALPTYDRTYRMENAWRGRLQLSGNVLALLDNRGVPYVRLVMDESDQAWMHKPADRWGNRTIQKIASDARRPTEKIFARYAEATLKDSVR